MLRDVPLGRVQLVGAGPGAADLMTLRALRAVQGAEALLYDALVTEDVLDLAPANCLRIQTGKRAGRTSMKQATINRLMLRLARRGLRVVRLKGGDPSVFGRVGEELSFLHAYGIETEVVPGVTAASAAAAQFGFPLTHRGEARRLVLATARVADGAVVDTGWAGLADAEATLALYMARDSAGLVADRLMAEGRDRNTPVVVVENAGRPGARADKTTLGHLGEAMAGAFGSGPTLILVGEVSAYARSSSEDSVAAAEAASSGVLMFRNASSLG